MSTKLPQDLKVTIPLIDLPAAAIPKLPRSATVTLALIDIPEGAILTGKAMKKGGFDFKGEADCDSTTAEFFRRPMSEVLAQLGGVTYDYVVIDDIRFS